MKSRVLIALVLGSLAGSARLSAQATMEHWVGTWATAPLSSPSQPTDQAQTGLGAAPTVFNNQTLRQVVHTSIGGDRVRVTLTNTFGTRPLVVGGAQIALRD